MRGIYLLLVVFYVFAIACDDAPTPDNSSATVLEQDKLIDSLSMIISGLRDSLDSIQDHVGTAETDKWFIENLHAKEMIQHGIEKPASFLRSELENRTELIPIKSVLGGNMAFRKIEILGSKWIIAEYDDGHIMGRAIYRYDWSEKEGVSFRLLDSVSW